MASVRLSFPFACRLFGCVVDEQIPARFSEEEAKAAEPDEKHVEFYAARGPRTHPCV